MRRVIASFAAFLALAVFGCAFSAPAVACLCNCSIFSTPGKYPVGTKPRPAEYYEQVFSGLVISTERTREPVVSPPVVVGKTASGDVVVEDPGHWIRSRVLVSRIWRGTPSAVAEVWTPILSDCDVQPIAGFPFVALARTEKGRSVAGSTYCDCDEKTAARKGRGAFTIAGAVAGILLVAFGLFLVGFTVAAFARPAVVERFLGLFASSARAHYTEQGVRLLIGASLVVFSAAMWQPKVFWFVGWAVVLSSLALILAPWQWHRRFGTKVRPILIRRMKLFAVGVLAFGALLLHGVFTAFFPSAA
jgi:hypothetical protein